MPDFKKGDTCYIVGHRDKYSSSVKSVGSKFLTTTCGVRFSIEGGDFFGGFGFSIYKNESEYADYLEKCKKVLQIKEKIGNQLSLEQVNFILNYLNS